jgi:hypothetical protein
MCEQKVNAHLDLTKKNVNKKQKIKECKLTTGRRESFLLFCPVFPFILLSIQTTLLYKQLVNALAINKG